MKRWRGFSLMEMLLVLALIAVASLLAVAAFGGGMQGMKLRAGAKDVAAQMRFARAVAISSGQPQDVVIDPQARRWQGAKGRSGTLPDGGEIGLGQGAVVGLAPMARAWCGSSPMARPPAAGCDCWPMAAAGTWTCAG